MLAAAPCHRATTERSWIFTIGGCDGREEENDTGLGGDRMNFCSHFDRRDSSG